MRPLLERSILKIDNILKLLYAESKKATRMTPARSVDSIHCWTEQQLRDSQGEMRINHTGEICAQALYEGHAGSSELIDHWIKEAGREEYDHLVWCEDRLKECNTSPSIFNPLFYLGSFSIARALSMLNPSWNIMFIKETERQVQEHLFNQKETLSHDQRSREIIDEMILDEKKHHDTAMNFGAKTMPEIGVWIMKMSAAIMKKIVFYR
jgi:ubiquinone biosynthesis monooxygenase Coq7